MIYVVISTGATVLWFLLAVFLSHQNGADTYQTSIGLAERIKDLMERMGLFEQGGIFASVGADPLPFVHSLLRRTAHVGIYAVLAVLVGITMRTLARHTKLRIPIWTGAAFCIFWCWADEATKIPVEGRHFSWIDVGLNLLGCGIGLVVLLIIKRIHATWRKSHAVQ